MKNNSFSNIRDLYTKYKNIFRASIQTASARTAQGEQFSLKTTLIYISTLMKNHVI